MPALLFLVFAIALVFLSPWAVRSASLGPFALVALALFLLPVFVASASVWRRGGLPW
ncbi:NADH-quinone oxidoreductase subunit A, partial [Mycobacterium tuberculosis]|uniref:NADH-quinone oxidoreductase subunit A n=1 Tax=Mycobacterium tuberculosis TaxID=1773 RepID=UPI003C6DD08E